MRKFRDWIFLICFLLAGPCLAKTPEAPEYFGPPIVDGNPAPESCRLMLHELWPSLQRFQHSDKVIFVRRSLPPAEPGVAPNDPAIHVHNPELLSDVLKIAQSENAIVPQQDLLNTFWKLLSHDYFELPLTDTGALIASGVSIVRGGGMGRATWGRDLVRAIRGARSLFEISKKILAALDSGKVSPPPGVSMEELQLRLQHLRDEMSTKSSLMLHHMLKAMSTPAQLQRMSDHIRDPSRHIKEGSMSMPRVRWDPETYDDVMRTNPFTGKPEVWPWNHMQLDFYYSSLRTIMNAIRENWLDPSELPDNERAYISMMLAMPLSMQYWLVHSSDAWEEGNARRTSTIIMGSALYYYFLKGRTDHYPHSARFAEFYDQILGSAEDNHSIPHDVIARIKLLTSSQNISRSLSEARKIFSEQLPFGEAPTGFHPADPLGKRGADAALLHALWYDLLTHLEQGGSYIGPEEVQTILKHVKSLERENGIIRYENDVYLPPFFWLKPEEEIPGEYTRSGQPIKAAVVHQAFESKNYQLLLEIFGPGFEAQWTIHDPLRSSISGDIALSEGAGSEYLDEFRYHFARYLGQITGTKAEGNEWLLAADGYWNKSWQSPEAWLLYRNLKTGECLSVPCPHSPLYWTDFEGARAFEVGWQLSEELH